MSSPTFPDQTPPPAKSGPPWLWIILGVFAVLMLGCLTVCGSCIYVGTQTVKEGVKQAGEALEILPIASIAEDAVAAHPTVQEKLGEPISLSGAAKREGTGPIDHANTVVLFDVTGPKGTAVVTARAKQTDGAWQVSNIKVQFNDGSTADVAPPGSSPPQLNF